MTFPEAVLSRLDVPQVDRLARGALVLASAAQESALAALLDWTRSAVAASGPVALLGPDAWAGVEACAVVTMVGSAAGLAEQLPGGDEPLRALRALERAVGHRADAVVALNTAVENLLLTVTAAAVAGLPVVDGDGCGRVLPLLEQSVFTLGGVAVTPAAVATARGDVLVVDRVGGRVEDVVRPLLPTVGGWAVAACYPMDGAALAGAVVPGTVSRAVRTAEAEHGERLAAWAPRRLCRGRITEVDTSRLRRTGGARTTRSPEVALPSVPTSVVVTESEGLRRRFRLEAHNEILLALADGAVAASAPDQILLLSAGRRVLEVEQAEPGVEVEVVVIEAAAPWRTPEGRALARRGGPEGDRW
ncbi:DUF917 family protein [Kitasatospora phosalacinea]|uniref:S-methyl thiohydantoin desulfurase domain-containing protein n=1 Tax=Kitasatospora phosalacinea TaxID=2065 RepID=UPI003648CD6E